MKFNYEQKKLEHTQIKYREIIKNLGDAEINKKQLSSNL